MNEQVKRIQGFVESLEKNVLNEEQQSLALTSDLDSTGGDNTNICVNRELLACSGSNSKCINHNVCSLSDNTTKCDNKDFEDDSTMDGTCE